MLELLSSLTPVYYFFLLLCAWLGLSLYLRRWRRMKLVAVIDGDTFDAVDSAGKRRRLRLQGVDCPEMGQRNGQEAKDFVKVTVGPRWVQVRLIARDKYRRHIADVRVDGKSLALLLVKVGLAYPLSASWGMRIAAAGARLSRKGVYAGFGQAKPWQSGSRTWLGRLFFRRKKYRNIRSSRK